MRITKFIYLLMLTLLTLLIVAACTTASAPKIVVDPLSQELGEVPQEKIKLVYTVRNDGGNELQIDKITTSCDCTKAVIEQEKIAPGDSAALTVTLDPAEDNLYGDITRVIYLRSNDPANPEVSVEFHAVIQKPQE